MPATCILSGAIAVLAERHATHQWLVLNFAEYVHRSYFGVYSANKISYGGRIPLELNNPFLWFYEDKGNFSKKLFVSKLLFDISAKFTKVEEA